MGSISHRILANIGHGMDDNPPMSLHGGAGATKGERLGTDDCRAGQSYLPSSTWPEDKHLRRNVSDGQFEARDLGLNLSSRERSGRTGGF